VSILVADDDVSMRALLRALLTRGGYVVVETADGRSAISELASQAFDVVVTDLAMPGADGFEVLARARELQPQTPVLVLTADGSIRDCVKAMREGAFNFLTKPFHPKDLLEFVAQALHARSGGNKRTPHPRASQGRDDGRSQLALIGDSPALKAVIDLIERIAQSDATVLISGESGTGKEVVARLLHGSSRPCGPFVAINCGAIPESLLESELFGHTKGSFTGASEARVGKFLQADGGTLFLDEIGDLPLSMQVKLLRVLQEREVTPVGDSRARPIDVRIIAASNLDLEVLVREKRFRQDLYYRLDVLPVRLPALRERSEDIPLLASHFLDAVNRRLQKTVVLGEDALALLKLYAWPGNVREMENLFERLVILDRTGTIGAEDLPDRMRGDGVLSGAAAAAAAQLARGSIDLTSTLAALEGSLIEQALRQAGGNKTHAAESLGLNRTTFVDKTKRH
jgi:two-component system, NtrC family, response regulator AtoC